MKLLAWTVFEAVFAGYTDRLITQPQPPSEQINPSLKFFFSLPLNCNKICTLFPEQEIRFPLCLKWSEELFSNDANPRGNARKKRTIKTQIMETRTSTFSIAILSQWLYYTDYKN